MANSVTKLVQDESFKISFKVSQALKARALLENLQSVEFIYSIGLGEGSPFEDIYRRMKYFDFRKDVDESIAAIRSSQIRLETEKGFYNNDSMVLFYGHKCLEPFALEPMEPIHETYCDYGQPSQEKVFNYLAIPTPSLGIIVVGSKQAKIWSLHKSYTSNSVVINLSSDIKLKKELLSKKIMNLLTGPEGRVCSILAGVEPSNQWATDLLVEKYADNEYISIHTILAADDTISPIEFLVRRQAELAKSTKFLKEIKALDSFFSQDVEEITRGRKTTLVAIRRKAIKTLLVAEDNELVAVTNENRGDDVDALESIGLQQDYDPKLQNQPANVRVVPFLLWLYRNVSSVKGEVVLVSAQSVGGVRLKEECQGIGAILSSKQYIHSSDDD